MSIETLLMSGRLTGGPAPGPGGLIGGDEDAGFYGELSSEDFVKGSDLALFAGITAGVAQNDDVSWLKFALDGGIVYIPKKPLRYAIMWGSINAAGAAAGKIVTFKGKAYRLRLIRGSTLDPAPVQQAVVTAPATSEGSEWNRLIYPVCEGTWASYSAADMQFSNQQSQSWCQEAATTTGHHILRGISRYNDYCTRPDNDGSSPSYRAWRPLLEFVA